MLENIQNSFSYWQFGIIHFITHKQIHEKSLQMGLKSKAKPNTGLLNFKSASELSIVKNWKEKCNCLQNLLS